MASRSSEGFYARWLSLSEAAEIPVFTLAPPNWSDQGILPVHRTREGTAATCAAKGAVAAVAALTVPVMYTWLHKCTQEHTISDQGGRLVESWYSKIDDEPASSTAGVAAHLRG
jgi:hypothetical protein